MDSLTNTTKNREIDTTEVDRENSSLDNEVRDIRSSSNSCPQGQLFRNIENIRGQSNQKVAQEIERLLGLVNARCN